MPRRPRPRLAPRCSIQAPTPRSQAPTHPQRRPKCSGSRSSGSTTAPALGAGRRQSACRCRERRGPPTPPAPPTARLRQQGGGSERNRCISLGSGAPAPTSHLPHVCWSAERARRRRRSPVTHTTCGEACGGVAVLHAPAHQLEKGQGGAQLGRQPVGRQLNPVIDQRVGDLQPQGRCGAAIISKWGGRGVEAGCGSTTAAAARGREGCGAGPSPVSRGAARAPCQLPGGPPPRPRSAPGTAPSGPGWLARGCAAAVGWPRGRGMGRGRDEGGRSA